MKNIKTGAGKTYCWVLLVLALAGGLRIALAFWLDLLSCARYPIKHEGKFWQGLHFEMIS